MRLPALMLALLLAPWWGRAEDVPAAIPAAPGAGSRAELQAQLSAWLAQPRFAGALWGVEVLSLDTGRTLFSHHPERRMSPASSCKLYPAALALVRLGADYRLPTPVLATGTVDPTGTLRGDLVIAGRGDPGWNTRGGTGDFWSVFAPFVALLQQAGVRTIAGDIVADATWLRGQPLGASWTADDLQREYGAEISALSLFDNFVELRATPAATPGEPCRLELLLPLTGLVLENRTRTAPAGSARTLRVHRLPGETRVLVEGRLPLGGEPELTEVSVPRPAAWFAAGLTEALRRAGISVAGRPRALAWPEPPPRTDLRLGELASAPLRDLVAALMKPSQNLETDLIFAHLGEHTRRADTPEWVTSEELAVAALEAFLREFDLRPEGVQFDEGSGLSRNNLASAAALVRLLEFMAARPEASDFIASLPVAGRDGTLRRRLQGTPAEGRLRAKTGTLRWASTLSGYVTTAAGERLAFSLMLNRHVSAPGHRAAEELDVLAGLLAGYHGRD